MSALGRTVPLRGELWAPSQKVRREWCPRPNECVTKTSHGARARLSGSLIPSPAACCARETQPLPVASFIKVWRPMSALQLVRAFAAPLWIEFVTATISRALCACKFAPANSSAIHNIVCVLRGPKSGFQMVFECRSEYHRLGGSLAQLGAGVQTIAPILEHWAGNNTRKVDENSPFTTCGH